jgi:uncharacterized membrane protein YvbJ
MLKSCPYCGAWDQPLNFCQECGKKLVFASIDEQQAATKDSPKVESKKPVELPLIIAAGVVLFIMIMLLFSSK